MSAKKDPHAWLDKYIEQQRQVHGACVTRLIDAAARAEEFFSQEELEEHARKQGSSHAQTG
jgi:hypothetical protein